MKWGKRDGRIKIYIIQWQSGMCYWKEKNYKRHNITISTFNKVRKLETTMSKASKTIALRGVNSEIHVRINSSSNSTPNRLHNPHFANFAKVHDKLKSVYNFVKFTTVLTNTKHIITSDDCSGTWHRSYSPEILRNRSSIIIWWFPVPKMLHQCGGFHSLLHESYLHKLGHLSESTKCPNLQMRNRKSNLKMFQTT